LQRALQLDETYAPAHARLAIATVLLGNNPGSYGDLTLEEVTARAVPHIERALELEPQLAEAFAARTLLGLAAAEYQSVIENGRRTLELNPSNAEVLNWMYIPYEAAGDPAAAIGVLEQLISVDPLSVVGRMNIASRLTYSEGISAGLAMAESLAETSRAVSYTTSGKIHYYHGDLVEALRLTLQAYALDARDTITSTVLARVLGQLDLVAEGLRLPGDVHVWVYWNQGMWPQLITSASQAVTDNPADPFAKLLLADALHLSGDVEQAQGLYEELIASQPGRPVSDLINESVAPTARAAFGRLASGRGEDAEQLANIVAENLEQRRQAWLVHGEYYRAAAIIAAVRGDDSIAMEMFAQAVRNGPHDPSLFSEPAFDRFRNDAAFEALQAEFQTNLDSQRIAARQMLCFDNPAPDAWPPLPETCAGISTP
jgi:tetratricopeptide (TPR) repeat protein